MLKRVVVHLDTGIQKEHEIEAKDDDDYAEFVEICVDALARESIGGLIFTDPYCIYKAQNIVAIEFLDPPPPTKELSIGFKPPK